MPLSARYGKQSPRTYDCHQKEKDGREIYSELPADKAHSNDYTPPRQGIKGIRFNLGTLFYS